eukprot:6182967-Pleurochrysis_carterae.AAC.8
MAKCVCHLCLYWGELANVYGESTAGLAQLLRPRAVFVDTTTSLQDKLYTMTTVYGLRAHSNRAFVLTSMTQS